jgi:5,10-methylenetetrahydromethanopterin reductase
VSQYVVVQPPAANDLSAPTELSPLGVYVLPGRVGDPRPVIGQARTAEHLGLGAVWIGERYGTKDFGVLVGAIGQATRSVRIGTAIAHFVVRHPMALASAMMTAQALTDGRFVLGVGRSVDAMWKAVGLPRMTSAVMVDSADIIRRLCRGERVSYDGPAGRFPAVRLGDVPDVQPPPILLAAIGPKSLALAGSTFDGVILHPFLTAEAVGRSAAAVRRAAEVAGRDPADVRVCATVVVAPDLTPDEQTAIVAARAVTYFQIPGFGELLAGVNGWDTAPLTTLRSHPQMANLRGAADSVFTRAELAEVSALLPSTWLTDAAAVGTAGQCASRLREYLAAGADEIILHGSTAELLGPTLQHVAAGEG